MLELVFTNDIYLVEDDTSDPIGKNDHTVIINTNLDVTTDYSVKRRLYYKGQYDKMRSFFTVFLYWKTSYYLTLKHLGILYWNTFVLQLVN